MEEGVDKLLFELASESRLSILHELEARNLRMQEIARILNLTSTEAFRQLNRLSDATLVEKTPNGSYAITPYGRLALQLTESLEFVSKNKKYLVTRNVWRLPYQFINRIGELSKSTVATDLMDMMNRSGQGIAEAEERIWVIGSQPSDSLNMMISERLAKGAKVRVMFHESLIPAYMGKIEVLGNFEMRTLSEVPAFMVCTEKAAGINLLSYDGRPDYLLFYGRDPKLIQWATDLFQYYWDKGKRL